MKFYGTCVSCRKNRFFLRKAEVKFAGKFYATSKHLMCRKCRQAINKAFEKHE